MRTACFRFIFFSAFVLCWALSGRAQEFNWNVGSHLFFDNREYAPTGGHSQTIFGLRLAPEVSVTVGEKVQNSLVAGASMMFNFGNSQVASTVPTIYYHGESGRFEAFMGYFPREGLLSDYPRALLNDTLNYYRPNIQGFLLKYQSKNYVEKLWIDWTVVESSTSGEQFLMGFEGTFTSRSFFFKHFFQMTHSAGYVPHSPYPGVQDNGGLVLLAGWSLKNRLFLDEISIAGGGLAGFERLRAVSDTFKVPVGGLAELLLVYKSFSIRNLFYAGQSQNIFFGDPFYNFKRYDRLDFKWMPRLYKNIDAMVCMTFHFAEHAVSTQQIVGLRYNVGGPIGRKKQTNDTL